MEGDRPGDAGPEQPQDHVGGPTDPGTPVTQPPASPLGMGTPSDVPGGYSAETFGAETTLEQRGWLSGSRITALVTAVVLVVAGTAVAVVLSGGDGAQLEDVVPAGAVAFGKANLIPPGDQAEAVRSLIGRFPVGDGGSVGDSFESFLDEGLGQNDLSFERDVAPWLGAQVGFVVTEVSIGAEGPQARWALLAAVRNEAAAKSALDRIKATEDAFAYAIREGTAFMAPELLSLESVLAAVDGKTGPLSEDPNFTAAIARVSADNLGVVYLDGEQLTDVIPPGSVPGALSVPGGAGRSVIALRAEQDAMVLEGFGTGAGQGKSGAPALVEGVPEEILGALTLFDPANLFEQGIEFAGLFLLGFSQGFGSGTVPGFGPGFDEGFSGSFEESITFNGQQAPEPREMVDDLLRETFGLRLDRDVLPWMRGELSVVVGRLSLGQPEVGVLIESTDDAAAGRTIDALRDNLGRLGRDGGFEVTAAQGGFAVLFPDVGITVVARRVAGKVVVASSDSYADQLLGSSAKALAGDTVYRRSVGEPGRDDVVFQMYLRIDRLASFLQVFVPPGEYEKAEAYFGELEALGIRATSSGEGSTFRMVLTFK